MNTPHDVDFMDFCAHHETLLAGLARMGWTASEAFSRTVLVYPHIDREFLERAIASDRWPFVGRQEHMLNHTLISAALWYAVAVTYDLEPDFEYAAVGIDPIILHDVSRMMESRQAAPDDIAFILGKIGAALDYLTRHPYTELDEGTYDELLADLPPELATVSRDGFLWPPARAVVEERLGDRSWQRALLKCGICPPGAAEEGIQLAASSLSERTFRNALGDFLSFCVRYDRKPSVMLYGQCAEESRQGRVPHLGAVRARYGSWHRALQEGRTLINDALNMGDSAALPVRTPGRHDPTEPLKIEDIKAQGIGVVQPKKLTDDEREEQAWQGLTDVMLQRLEELPWSLSLRLYYISPQAVEAGDYTNYVSVLRSPAGYFCELTGADEFESLEVNIDGGVLTAAGWQRPTGSGHWTKNFLSVSEAASSIINAMRYGMGCQQPDYFQSDDPATLQVAEVNPSTGSVPMVPVTGEGYVSIEDF
ncbi:MAG: hypothetical protein Q3965_00310 [Rothia sp. (in: high G+C Gram-positive bacteria)]|nr:hypothetical protein [Rothia sp. (in: high G+C Gram-positive bacteria)]